MGKKKFSWGILAGLALFALGSVAVDSSGHVNFPVIATGGTWSLGPNLITPRGAHHAVLLGDGRVLVAGGYNGAYLSDAEIYNPTSNAWSPAGSMATSRLNFTMTTLADGKVLAAGGYNEYGYVNSPVLYNPDTNSWSGTGAMLVARQCAIAALLPNGKVLVAGGSDPVMNEAELYDPVNHAWTIETPMNYARIYHVAVTLKDGRVLVIGGSDFVHDDVIQTSAEIYDPTFHTWTLTGPLNVPRGSDHTATLLDNGKVLVAGGHITNVTHSAAEVFDPDTNAWSLVASMTAPRFAHTATLLPGGNVLVTGGYAPGSNLATAEIYDPGADAWSAIASMSVGRTGHTATRLNNGKALIAAGHQYPGVQGALNISEFYTEGGTSDTTPPVIGPVTDISVDATSPLGAVVTFTLPPATDDTDPAPSVIAVPASGSLFPIGTTTVTVTARDASGNSSSKSFTVTVLSASKMISNLIVTANIIFPQAANLLQSALDSLNNGNTKAGCNQMNAFINQVQAQSGKKKLTVAQANQLIASANHIQSTMGCR